MVFSRFQTWKNELLALLLLVVLGYMSFFHHLGYQHMNLWDESSYGLNALEMAQRANPVEVYLLGQPDLYNTKPPLAIWCMSIAVKCFGFTEKGVRFASAFFGFLTVFILWFSGYRITSKPFQSLLMPLVLLSSTGFVGEHLARTGDTDAILACWICVYSLCFFKYTVDPLKSNTWLMAFFIAFSCACLTKGIAGFTAIPGIVLWAASQRLVKSLLRNKWFYIGLCIFLVLVPGYYLLRNLLTPGYIDTVVHYEFLGRIERQEFLNPEPRGFWFYYQQLWNHQRLVGWIWILIPSCFLIVFAKPGKLKRLCLFFLLMLGSISLLLGISSTKLFWYDAPLYPMMAGVIGGGLMLLMEQTKPVINVTISLGFVGLFVYPFGVIAERNHNPDQTQHVREAIRSVRNEFKYKDTLLVVSSEVNFAAQFYLVQDSLYRGRVGRIVPMDDNRMKEGAYFMTCKYAREADMNNRFILDTLYRQYECGFFRIRGRKETNP